MYICNAFSLQMLDTFPASVKVEEVETISGLDLTSAIGHADTARVLGFEPCRLNVKLGKGDSIIVAQLVGGRLPEGATTLPEGFTFKFLKVTVE